MRQTNDLKPGKPERKLLGSHLIKAGLITSDQIDEALIEQKNNENIRLGEILVKRGWIKQNTLDYFMKEIIEVTRINTLKKSPDRKLSLPTFYLSPKRISRSLLIAIAFLILASILAQVAVYFLTQFVSTNATARLFDLGKEGNIPTIYSALTLALCSIMLAIISYIRKGVDSRYTGYWKFLSLIFLYLSLDEACAIHEILTAPLRLLLNTSGFLYFTWVIPGFIFLVIFLLGFWQFIKALPQKTRNLFIQAGTLYVGGTLGMEMISAYYADVYGENTIAYLVTTTIEESLEMLGIVVFIYALLSYIKLHIEEVKFCLRFDSNRDK